MSTKSTEKIESQLSEYKNNEFKFVYNEQDPRSVVNIVSPELAQKVRNIPRLMFSNDPLTLEKELKPTDLQYAIKANFWRLYGEAVTNGDVITIDAISHGICTPTHCSSLLEREKFAAWVFYPTQDYNVLFNVMFKKSLCGLNVVLDKLLVEIGEEDEVNINKAKLLLTLHDKLANRAIGTEVQRIEQKSMHVNVDVNKQLTPEELNKQIKAMREQLGYKTTLEIEKK